VNRLTRYRWASWLGAVTVALVLGACAAGRSGADPSARFFSVHNALRSNGMTQLGPVNRGQLGSSQSAKLALELGGQCVTVVALAAGDVADIDVALASPDGKVVASDDTRGPDATLRYCPDHPGKYQLTIKMVQGAGTFLVTSWTGGAAPSSGEGAAASTAATTGAGTCESPIVAMPGQTYVGDTEDGRSMEEGSCGSTTSREMVYRIDVPARERVVIEVNAQFDSVLYVRKDDCQDRDAEVACNDDSGGPKRSRIDEVFDAGTYFIFVDGYQREEGGFRMTVNAHSVPGASDSCTGLPVLAASAPTSGQLGRSYDRVHASCGRDAKGPDASYRFDLATRSTVRITEDAQGFTPVLHLRTSCNEPSSEVACRTPGSFGNSASYVGVLDPGTYWVTADSAGDSQQGQYTLRADAVSEAGGVARADSCGDAESLAGSSGQIEADTFGARDDVAISCGATGAADVVYRIDVGRRSHFVARVSADESNHVFAIERSCGAQASQMACGKSVDQILTPGTYFLVVEGSTPESVGKSRISYRLEDLSGLERACAGAQPIVLGKATSGTTTGMGNHFTPQCASVDENQDSSDRVYQFRLDKRTNVRAMLSATGFIAALSIRRTCSDPTSDAGCSMGYSPGSRVQVNRTLEPGTYYVVVDGRGGHSEGEFNLTVDGSSQDDRTPQPARPGVTPAHARPAATPQRTPSKVPPSPTPRGGPSKPPSAAPRPTGPLRR
jgi:hypothetical protein